VKDGSDEFVKKLVLEISMAKLEDRVFVTAPQVKVLRIGFYSDRRTLVRAKELNPAIKTHLISTFPYSLTALQKECDADVVSFGWLADIPATKWLFNVFDLPRYRLRRQVAALKKKGVKVLGGISDERRDIERFLRFGVDGLFIDDVRRAKELLWK
jgi:glycerophosphoryl diester phosphodiesterase